MNAKTHLFNLHIHPKRVNITSTKAKEVATMIKSKKYIITKETVNHLNQPIRYSTVVDAEHVQMVVENAKLEGYAIVSVNERD